ncbi:F-box only protein 15 [Parambassis ranga]|uniref:F-box only protein 15 n=1 Tax=Parambassis ranga TaxID=210632 RepID=A0A6P7KPF8_9TELE|nr:F-box only protein 15 [Parambassis ranga]
MPCEILLKILSYLDASALHVIGHVSKHFNQLANDNGLWKKVYSAELLKYNQQKPMSLDALLLKQTLKLMQVVTVVSWKLHYFRTIGFYDLKKRMHVRRSISTHTGLPVNAGLDLNSRCKREKKTQITYLRKLHISWGLTVIDKSGREITLDLGLSHISNTSVTLCWYTGDNLPVYKQISTLQLYGIRRIDLNCPGLNKPGWRSLITTVDFKDPTRSAQSLGTDRLIEMKLLQPGVVMGVWRDTCSVAFFMFTLHSHRLLERSIFGSLTCPCMELGTARFDDVDPEYGLHGYQLHIALHNIESEFMSERFPSLFCRRDQISDGLIPLAAISSKIISQHIRLPDNITLPWRSEGLQGTVKNCFIMSLTLLEENRKPFLCITTPVSIKADKAAVCYDWDSATYLMNYQDSDSHVKMKFVWLSEKEQFVLVSLTVYLSVKRVNEYFGREY